MTTTQRNIKYDYIRIFATLGVFFCHLSQYLPYNIVKNIFSYGSRGVEVFFVLSGFLVIKSIKELKLTAKSFFIRRASKILPLYYGTVIIEVIFVEHNHLILTPDEFGLGWLRYAFGIHAWIPSSDSIWTNMFALWTMSSFFSFIFVRLSSQKQNIILVF